MKDWSRRWNKFRSLSFYEKYLFFKIGILMMLFRFLLSIFSFRRFSAFYTFLIKRKSKKDSSLGYERLAFLIKTAANIFPFKLNCLPQSLVFKYFCPTVNIQIGVQHTPGEFFEAHAWVEEDGKILIGDFKEGGFTPIWAWK